MSRLASFKGPSTPTSSPVRQSQPTTPASPSRLAESTYHRKVRTLLQELRAVTETWDDLVLVDGLKSSKSLVDARTDLDNDLGVLPPGTQPTYRVVQPKLELMERRIAELDAVITKLRKQFQKMTSIIDNMEALLYDAHKTKGWHWVQEPLWVTWSLERFGEIAYCPAVVPEANETSHIHPGDPDSIPSIAGDAYRTCGRATKSFRILRSVKAGHRPMGCPALP